MEKLESGRFRKKTLSKGSVRSSDNTAKEEEETVRSISYFTLFRFASKFDVLLITVALVSTILSGISLPLAIAVVARAFGDMIEYEKSAHQGTQDANEFLAAMYGFGINYSSLGVIIFLCGYLGSALINIAAINQMFKMREAYIKATLNQDFTYYDTHQTGDFASKMSENILKLQDGIGDKLSITMYNITIAVACMTMALLKGWKLALMCLISSPISFLLVGLTGIFAQRFSKREAKESGLASAIAEDVLSSIRTVYSFNGQATEVNRYSDCLANVKKIDIKKVFFTGLAMSLLIVCMFSSYGLSFYFGVYLVLNDPDNYNAEVMFSVFFMVMSGLTSLGMLGTLVGTFGTARGAGANIFSVLDNQPSIDPLLDRGLKPEHIEGNIEFKNVVFRYMSRPGAPVLQGLSFSVRRGQSVALVGRSGCGKSTAIRLILRHYDVSSGNVLLDNVDVRDVSVRWLRAQVGLVGQEPVLFNTTVRENIRYGREDASDADIEAAARQANAHHFITKLPKGYQTLVGERGTSLSGGQKQRIAIARALIRNPIILLLDEATSALDSTCEAKVQKALDMAAKGRTTLIVAHRLSTIRNVDVIYVLDNGKVAEQGTHDELIKAQGMYYNMQLLQGSMETSQPTKEFSAVDAAAQESEITLDRRSMLSVTSLADHERKMPPLSLRRLISLNAPERTILIIGCTTSIVTGFALPIYVLCFGDLLGALSNPKSDVVMAKSIEVGITFVAIGFIIGTFTLIEHMSFGVAGASLAQRLRALMFQHLMRQDIAFYDNRVNSTGALCARLSADAAYVRAATGQRIGTVLQGVGCIGLALTLAMVHEWRVALVALAFFPLVFLVMHYEGKASSQESFKDAASVEESTKIAVEAVSNVRTVVSLGREQKFIEEYTAALRPAIGPAKRAAHFRGIVTGLSRSVFNFMNSAALILGAHLIINEGIRYENILIATQSLQLASGQLQAAFTYSADFQKGIRAASRVLAFLNTKPTVVDPEMPFVAPFRSSGSAKFEQVEFSYPTRPGVQALRGLDLQIPAGKTVALVGESGCGKSTTVCLLQRFYDAEAGVITMDEIPLQQLLVNDVRGNLGLVSQEPVLFNRTIRENIAYGDNSRAPTDDEIIEVATQANIHKFIEALPQGYDTTIGSKGVQLSGGQKQRVAIARALVRRPKILLLDEATSALDTESEKVVQAALDRAKEGRTCLMVAHRLSTVRDADEICVFQRGLIVERGTHSQLMDLKGFYYDLHKRGL